MQFKSLNILDQFRDVVGTISLEELIANQKLIEMIVLVEALIKFEPKGLSL